jgi:hypothetical protein
MDASETTVPFSPAERGAIPQDTAWQERLLPVMAGSLAILTLFFCASLTYETILVQRHIESAHEIDLNPLISKLDNSSAANSSAAVNEFRVKVLSILEANAIERRYHQASAASMGRIYLIFLGFATGMVLSLAGATFILGKVREAPTEVGGAGPSFKAMLRSGSPGLVLAAFGTVLMLSTIFSRADITVTDQALYLGPGRETAEIVTGREKDKEAVQKPSDILRQQVEPLLKGERTKNGATK